MLPHYVYKVFWYEPDQCYFAVVPDVPELRFISAFGATPEFAVKIYEADLGAATDVSALPALAGATYTPAAKKRVLDVARTGISRVDNLEGMAFGPLLANGNRSLVLVSDNNFNPLQLTQFLAFEVLTLP